MREVVDGMRGYVVGLTTQVLVDGSPSCGVRLSPHLELDGLQQEAASRRGNAAKHGTMRAQATSWVKMAGRARRGRQRAIKG